MVHFETFFLYERRTEMSVLVMIMLLHANNIIFVGFWPNHFALSVYTTTDRIFQDVAVALSPFLTLHLTNPHPLTHSLHFAALAKLCPNDTKRTLLYNSFLYFLRKVCLFFDF